MSKKHIVITGAASGIGKLLAKKCLTHGLYVTLIDLNKAGLDNFANENVAFSDSFTIIAADLCDKFEMVKVQNYIEKGERPVDILVNNAGIVSGKNFIDLEKSDVEKTFQVNVFAPFFLAQSAAKSMIRRNEGHIINLCSASSLVGVPKLSDYAASKAAILSMDESLRLELKEMKSNVKTTAICPFYINTGMFDGVKTRFPFLLPILKPDYVVEKIYRAIIHKDDRVVLPIFVYSIFLIKILPPRIFDALLAFFGVNSSMEKFKGRQ